MTSRITDTFFSLHPEQRQYQDPRLKGSRNATKDATNSSSIAQTATNIFSAAGASTIGSAVGATGEVVRPDLT